jgi:hypothetical protein
MGKYDVLSKSENDGNIAIEIENKYFCQKLYRKDFLDQKEMTSYIKKVESIVRSSLEYRELLYFLKNEINLNTCVYLNNISDLSIELHHTPFTLFDIVSVVITSFIKNDKLFNTFIIANDVLKLYYENLIGLVPLSKTMHEVVHNGTNSLFINKELIFGDFESFFNKYKEFMDESLIERYSSFLEFSKERK